MVAYLVFPVFGRICHLLSELLTAVSLAFKNCEFSVEFTLRSNEASQAPVSLLQMHFLHLEGAAMLVVHPGPSWERTW